MRTSSDHFTPIIEPCGIAEDHYARSVLLRCEFVFQDAEAVYLDLDAIARPDGSYSGGGAGGDEVAGLEGHGGRDVAEQVGNGEDEVAGGPLLLDDAVEPRDNGDRAAAYRVDLIGDDGADGAEGVKPLAAGPRAVGLLDVAAGDGVEADVAADVGADVLVGADLVAAAADNDAELALEVDARGERRHAHNASGSEKRRWRLEKEHRLFGDFVAEFGGVLAIVAADAEDLRRSDGR